VVRVPGNRSRGPGFYSQGYQIFLEVVGLERVPLLVDLRAIVRLEGLGQLKNPMNLSGIEPANFRLVAQVLDKKKNQESKEMINLPRVHMSAS
jgi:hypothetical protein